ncbi:uncharacterized protein BDW70DRAFT_170925 [Aspergillus foveolatus]|uniref:uncharacterized protein n=1 Tax=Aspergillus foveolatus TaxID=210207 RepID=UPI003CCD6021
MSDSKSALVAGSSHRLVCSLFPGAPGLSSYTTDTPDTSTNRNVKRFAEPRSLLISLAFPRYVTRVLAVKLNEITLPWIDNRPIEPPGLTYRDSTEHRHRDVLSRIEWHREDDRYLSSTDGRLKILVVQATDDVRLGPRNGTWARTGIRNVTPIQMRIVYWVLKRHIEGKEKGMSLEVCLKWVPACLAIAVLLCIPADLGGEKRNNGLYEQFKYHFWGYSYIPSNPLEASTSPDPTITPADGTNVIADRPLRPRYLCFPAENGSVEIVRVTDWEAQHGGNAVLEYIFISYTSTQFDGPDDWDYLHSVAKAAVRSAGVPAYWISCSCMPEPEELSEDVYRISDIVRGSHSVVIIVGPPINSPSADLDMKAMLQHWGERIWTFPEVLLSPNTHAIAIYMRAGDMAYPTYLQKRNFPVVAWTDAPVSRQLVDHYEGSILLSPLELVTLALQCLSGRAHNTASFFPGDLTYVLMGLLRRRPRVNGNHSAFQEFCRLSLANDSNRLLERLICLLPSRQKREGSWEWHDIDDTWGRNLWDITPLCQVDGIGEDDTVILGGGFAAPIRWKSFTPVNMLLRNTIKRMVSRAAVRGMPSAVVLGAFFLATGRSQGGSFAVLTALGWLLMGPAIIAILFSPRLLATLYTGKPWRAQPWLFGFEGYMPIGEIETDIFGTDLSRLKWAPYSSELSRHQNTKGECIGVDPATDPAVREIINRARSSKYGDEKVFTLVDTNLMTVTLFSAVRPPVALVLCGSEGGMQRGLLCSYDWKSQTLYRESVLRVDTMVLEKMSRVDRFKLGLKRPLGETEEGTSGETYIDE